jgi:hypothetical protein
MISNASCGDRMMEYNAAKTKGSEGSNRGHCLAISRKTFPSRKNQSLQDRTPLRELPDLFRRTGSTFRSSRSTFRTPGDPFRHTRSTFRMAGGSFRGLRTKFRATGSMFRAASSPLRAPVGPFRALKSTFRPMRRLIRATAACGPPKRHV